MRFAVILVVLLAGGPAGQAPPGGGAAAGRVRVMRHAEPSFDKYLNRPTQERQRWFDQTFWRMVVFSPFFDDKLSWYARASLYLDLYGIHVGDKLAAQHPKWTLRDAGGRALYIPWGCSAGGCPQYAADVSNAEFRKWWIDQAKGFFGKGYRRFWIDDVSMEFRVGNGAGAFVAPVDPRTGAAMTWADWRRYIAEFVEQIRAAFPQAEIVHNAIWFAGPPGVRDRDSFIQRQIAACDYVTIEHGVNDTGLTGGTGEWSVEALLAYIDRVHMAGRGVILGGVPADPAGAEYALAGYYLISSGSDALLSNKATPDNWWQGFETRLGAPRGARVHWKGLLRRDFQGGMVLLNPPGSVTVQAHLPGPYKRLDASRVSTFNLAAKQALVLRAVGNAP